MPTYEYECRKCFHRFEQFQYIKDKALKKCPKCGKPALKRLIGSGGALIFRGSGFYINDYCRPKPPSPDEKGQKTGTKPSKPAVPAPTQQIRSVPHGMVATKGSLSEGSVRDGAGKSEKPSK